MSNQNKDIYNKYETVYEYSKDSYILNPEKTILNKIKTLASNWKMLDIGVGAGRTTSYFAPFFKEYIGIDYSEAMISICKEKYENLTNARFFISDARKMTTFDDNTFDFILFSFNGIDCVDKNERIQILKEIHRIGKENSLFAFSIHNSYNIPKLMSFQTPKNPLKYIKEFKRYKGVRSRNPSLSNLILFDQTQIIDGDLDFKAEYLYTKPEFQITQLNEIGFSEIQVYDLKKGKEITNNIIQGKCTDPWIHFLCKCIKTY